MISADRCNFYLVITDTSLNLSDTNHPDQAWPCRILSPYCLGDFHGALAEGNS